MPTKLPTDDVIDSANKLFESHAADVGRVALSWNTLHDALGELFAEVISPDGRSVALAAWQAVQSDRSKRKMLDGVSVAALGSDAKFTQEVKWANGQLNALEDNRNDAVHSPYSVLIEDGALKVVPYVFAGSVRARKLQGKNLELELRSYSTNMDRLRDFARGLLGKSLSPASDPSWPERPKLPRLAQATA